jgi:hypothetical protein
MLDEQFYVRFKSLEFWRCYEHYFIEFQTEVEGYKLRLLTKEQADELNKELQTLEAQNPLTAAEYIIKQVLAGRYDNELHKADKTTDR